MDPTYIGMLVFLGVIDFIFAMRSEEGGWFMLYSSVSAASFGLAVYLVLSHV